MAEGPARSPGRLASWWPHLRAALITLHLLAVIVMATPSLGSAMSREAWKNPTVQGELRTWADRLAGLGFDVDAARLEDALWAAASRWTEIRRTIDAPTDPYSRYLGVRQRWRMFAAPQRHPARLQIEIRDAAGWRTVYLERSPEHDWLGRQLDHDRMRSALFRYGWPHYRRDYHRLCGYIVRRADEDFPEANAVRIQLLRYRSASPEEVRRGEIPKTKVEGRFVRRLKRER